VDDEEELYYPRARVGPFPSLLFAFLLALALGWLTLEASKLMANGRCLRCLDLSTRKGDAPQHMLVCVEVEQAFDHT
jgi:hypothetical protein